MRHLDLDLPAAEGSTGQQKAVLVSLDGVSPEQVTLMVENKGVIPPGVREHLFDPFRGGQRQLGRREGLGLGLYIVQQIVLAHGGRVDVKTDARHTSFLVELPRR